ncbi:MAG: hypothetical protein BWK75_05700 [Candidatus Altiarchaeales archaeon A3]|nr:MAG: hypothetical protein BWK75_05700 [Candidatus Altiarchaeales archaeon A3]
MDIFSCDGIPYGLPPQYNLFALFGQLPSLRAQIEIPGAVNTELNLVDLRKSLETRRLVRENFRTEIENGDIPPNFRPIITMDGDKIFSPKLDMADYFKQKGLFGVVVGSPGTGKTQTVIRLLKEIEKTTFEVEDKNFTKHIKSPSAIIIDPVGEIATSVNFKRKKVTYIREVGENENALRFLLRENEKITSKEKKIEEDVDLYILIKNEFIGGEKKGQKSQKEITFELKTNKLKDIKYKVGVSAPASSFVVLGYLIAQSTVNNQYFNIINFDSLMTEETRDMISGMIISGYLTFLSDNYSMNNTNPGIETLLVVDEMGSFCTKNPKNSITMEKFKAAVQQGRKYGLHAIGISQLLSDFNLGLLKMSNFRLILSVRDRETFEDFFAKLYPLAEDIPHFRTEFLTKILKGLKKKGTFWLFMQEKDTTQIIDWGLWRSRYTP